LRVVPVLNVAVQSTRLNRRGKRSKSLWYRHVPKLELGNENERMAGNAYPAWLAAFVSLPALS